MLGAVCRALWAVAIPIRDPVGAVPGAVPGAVLGAVCRALCAERCVPSAVCCRDPRSAIRDPLCWALSLCAERCAGRCGRCGRCAGRCGRCAGRCGRCAGRCVLGAVAIPIRDPDPRSRSAIPIRDPDPRSRHNKMPQHVARALIVACAYPLALIRI